MLSDLQNGMKGKVGDRFFTVKKTQDGAIMDIVAVDNNPGLTFKEWDSMHYVKT